MATAHGLEETRNATFQKIGRNVVDFQKMEAMLKFVLAFRDLSGPISAIGPQVANRIALFAKTPMGRLVEEGAAGLYSDRSAAAPVSTSEIAVSISFSLDGGEHEARVWKAAMMVVVSERNRLIHQMLAGFDPRSVECCEKLSTDLDMQRERIIPAYEHLESLVRAVRAGHEELAESIDRTLAAEFVGESNNAA